MSFFIFNEDKKDIRNRAIIFLVALALGVIGVICLRSDILTSSAFYQSLGLQAVLRDNPRLEGDIFGVALSLIQVYLGYRLAIETVTRKKTLLLSEYVFVAIFDTYTDSDFRSFGMMTAPLTLKAVVVSFFVYNLFSEWAIGIAIKESVKNFPYVGLAFREMKQDYLRAVKQQNQRLGMPQPNQPNQKREDKRRDLPPLQRPESSPSHARQFNWQDEVHRAELERRGKK